MRSAKSKKKRAKKILTILAVVFAVLGCAVAFYLIFPPFRIMRNLKQAEKYMAVFDYDRAIESYDKTLKINGKEANAYAGLKKAYILKGDSVYDRDYDRAMECYENALSASKRGLSESGDTSFSESVAEIETMMEEKHKHDSGTYFDVKEPTCSEEGVRELRCNSCGEVIDTISIEKLPHTPGEWKEETAPDCTHAGLKVKKCTVCGTVVESEEIAMLPHEPGEWETERESDCAPGLKVRKCLNCGEVVESEEIPASKDHVKGSWETVKEPDCENPGERALKCKKCESVIETEEIPANGHTKDSKGEKFEDTDVLIYKCTVCGKVLEPESIAHVLYMDSLQKTEDDELFNNVNAEYDDKGKLVVSFSLAEEAEITDFGYIILNKTDLAAGIVVTFYECRNRVVTATSSPRNLNEPVIDCSITDTNGDIGSRLSASNVYYYRVFYIRDEKVYLSDFRRFVTKEE